MFMTDFLPFLLNKTLEFRGAEPQYRLLNKVRNVPGASCFIKHILRQVEGSAKRKVFTQIKT